MTENQRNIVNQSRNRLLIVLIEVYEDRVAIRPRNFAHRAMNRKVMIRNGKPYLEVPLQ